MEMNTYRSIISAVLLAFCWAANSQGSIIITGADGKPVRIPDIKSKAPPPPPPTGVLTMPPSTMFEVNGAALMTPVPGTNKLNIKPTTELPSPGDIGAFRMACRGSHQAFNDPIVYPGQPRRSHLHQFFGNTGINAHTTAASILTTGNSTCGGGVMNASGYWVPAVVDRRTGVPLVPLTNILYYKGSYGYYNSPRREQMVTPPKGLRMIAGNPLATPANAGYSWQCIPAGAAPKPLSKTIPGVDCPNGASIVMGVAFPNCWDGTNLDSPDHQSHMAYSNYTTGCPASHPVLIPSIAFNIHYTVTAKNRSEFWRLASDMYDPSLPGGASVHGDWFNGWRDDPATGRNFLDIITSECIRKGKDCHGHLLGDGRMLF